MRPASVIAGDPEEPATLISYYKRMRGCYIVWPKLDFQPLCSALFATKQVNCITVTSLAQKIELSRWIQHNILLQVPKYFIPPRAKYVSHSYFNNMRNSLQLSTKFCDIFINPEALSNRPRPHLLTLGYYYFIYTSAPDLFTVPLFFPVIINSKDNGNCLGRMAR